MKNGTYAREISKEYLEKLGLTYVSPDGNIIKKGDKVCNYYFDKTIRRPYFKINCYDHDLRFSVPKELRNSSTGQFQLGVHVVNWVWQTGLTKPSGYIVDHINNDSTDNRIENLQLLSPKQNLAKERKNKRKPEKMPKHITEDKINEKLEYWEAKYEQAKKDRDPVACHRTRSNLASWRSKQEQFLADPEKYTKAI